MAEKPSPRPAQYGIYKGINGKSGCLQFSLLPYNWEKAASDNPSERKEAKGGVLVQARNATGPNQYDNENQVKFMLSVVDLSAFLYGVTNQEGEASDGDILVSLFHKYGEASKKLAVKAGRLDKDGRPTYMCGLFEKSADGKVTRNVTVPISVTEMLTLVTLFRRALPAILGW